MMNDGAYRGSRLRTRSERNTFRRGFEAAKAAAMDRYAVETRGDGADEAIGRCIEAIEALDARTWIETNPAAAPAKAPPRRSRTVTTVGAAIAIAIAWTVPATADEGRQAGTTTGDWALVTTFANGRREIVPNIDGALCERIRRLEDPANPANEGRTYGTLSPATIASIRCVRTPSHEPIDGRAVS